MHFSGEYINIHVIFVLNCIGNTNKTYQDYTCLYGIFLRIILLNICVITYIHLYTFNANSINYPFVVRNKDNNNNRSHDVIISICVNVN